MRPFRSDYAESVSLVTMLSVIIVGILGYSIMPAHAAQELFAIHSDPTVMYDWAEFGNSVAFVDLEDGLGASLYVGAPYRAEVEAAFVGGIFRIYGNFGTGSLSSPQLLPVFSGSQLRLGDAIATASNFRQYGGAYYPSLVSGAWGGEGDAIQYQYSAMGVSGLALSKQSAPVGFAANYGYDVTTADFNGDGYADIVVGSKGEGSPGVVCIYLGGPEEDNLPDVAFTWSGHSGFGAVVAGVRDLTGNNCEDLIIGTTAGGVHLIYGRSMGQTIPALVVSLNDDPAVYQGREISALRCRGAVGGSDLTGDGAPDVVIAVLAEGAVQRHLVETYSLLQDETLSLVSTIKNGVTFGNEMAIGGDVDGDGVSDLVIGGSSMNTVAVYFGGNLPQFLDLTVGGPPEIARYQWYLSPASLPSDASFGSSVCFMGDQNGDGMDDVVVGAKGLFSVTVPEPGAVYGYSLATSDKIAIANTTSPFPAYGFTAVTTFSVAASHTNALPLAITMRSESLGIDELELTDNQDGTFEGSVSGLSVLPGDYNVEFFAVSPWDAETGGDGAFLLHRSEVAVVDVPVAYVDRSERLDGANRMPYQALPYSSVTVDFNGKGPRDMVVSLLNGRAQLYAATQMTVDGGIPAYYPVNDAFAIGSEPSLVLGLSVADVSGDGREELFGASQTAPRLYQLQDSTFVDMAPTWGAVTSALLSTAGAWADFDCDGDVDLAIGTSDCGVFEPGVYNIGPPVHDVLLRNDLNTAGTFTDISVASGLQADYYSNSTAVTWGDVNDDGFPDLFVGESGEPAIPPSGTDCRLFVNQRDGTFVALQDFVWVA